MLNSVNLMGRLTRDPELRHTQNNTAVASYTLAVERDFATDGKKETDFIDIIAWQKAGEFASKFFQKGQLVAVQGRLQMRKWTDKDGNQRTSIEIIAERQYFAESKKADQAASQSAAASAASFGPNGQYPNFTEMEDDGELPF